MLSQNTPVTTPVIYFDVGQYKQKDCILPHEVSPNKLKTFHGTILGYNPATILIDRHYGGIDVKDDGYYIKPEINLMTLFVATFKRTPFKHECVHFVVAKDVAIIASDDLYPSLDVDTGWSKTNVLTMTNNGIISGRGGSAGISAYRIEQWDVSVDHDRLWFINQRYLQSNNSTVGKDGGLAITGGNIPMAITNYGAITGGGGGGGGMGWWNYTAYSGGQDPLNECSGVLSNSGGAPYGQPFDSVLGWHSWLLFNRATGKLGAATFKYLEANTQGEFQVGKLVSGTFFYRYWINGVAEEVYGTWDAEDIRLEFIVRQLGSVYPHFTFRPNKALNEPWLEKDGSVKVGTVKVAQLAVRSSLKLAAEPGGDIGFIHYNPGNPNLNPYKVMEKIRLGQFEVGTPNDLERAKILSMRLGSKGGDMGENGADGFLSPDNISFDIYQPAPDKINNLGYRGIVNRKPPGTLNYSSPGSKGGLAGTISRGDVSITNAGSGYTRGSA